HEPRLTDLNAGLGYKDRGIEWRHLANQISCYGVVEAPSAAYDYSDYNMALLFDTLFLKVYGSTWDRVDRDVLHPKLTDLLQCQDNPTFMAFGTRDRPGRLGISVRDFARFGLLYLRKGNWRGKQLISAEHAAMAVTSPLTNAIPRTTGQPAQMIQGQRSIGGKNNQTDHKGSYSFAWWVNGVNREGKRMWPDAPLDTYGAFGHGGMRAMIVLPSLDLILCWNDSRIDGSEAENKALQILVGAVSDRPASPQLGQIVVDPDHPRWLRRYGQGPFFMCGPGDPEDFLYRGKLEPDGTRSGDQDALIRKLTGTGANCIYVMAVRSHGGDGDRTHNPFVDHDPAKGLNPKVLDQWETWFAALDRAGVVIFLFLYDDSCLVWNTGDHVGPSERDFIRTLVRRFKHHKHLIWCVAEEYNEKLSRPRVAAIAREIRAADGLKHPIAVHHNGLDFHFADDPCVDQFAVEYNVPTAKALHEGMVEAWGKSHGRYGLNMSEAADYGQGAAARKKSWACAMGGAYVMILGMDVAGTPVSDLKDCGDLVRFFESTTFAEMAPHDELEFGATEYVLAKPGHSYIAYASSASGHIGLRGLRAGAYDFLWFDCASGKQSAQSNVRVASGDQSWPAPSGFGPELAVYVTRKAD
ncbi:MAG: hypothetical protein JXQ73_15915, partial [Phycisphaerae bacterium]|nr:hypothetical protein [Phycisphaerae bacterium]